MRIPILMGVEGEAQEIVESYGAGVCFESENAEDFKLKLKTLSQSDKYSSSQSSCTRLADAFDRKVLSAKMLGVLEGQWGASLLSRPCYSQD